jgi:hypothetical protein
VHGKKKSRHAGERPADNDKSTSDRDKGDSTLELDGVALEEI